jgi:hypothetical protein
VIQTARDLLMQRYGDRLVSSIDETDVTVGTSVAWIAKRSGACIERIVSNCGAATIYVSGKSGVAANTGIPLAAGATLSLQAIVDFDLASCDLYAISGSAGNAVHIIAVNLVGAE